MARIQVMMGQSVAEVVVEEEMASILQYLLNAIFWLQVNTDSSGTSERNMV